MVELKSYLVDSEASGQRLDSYLAGAEVGISRSQVHRLIADGDAVVNGRTAKPGYRVREGDQVVLTIPEPQSLALTAEDIPLNILYEDRDVIVINKARGMVVHPATGNYTGTLVNALLQHCTDLTGINNTLRPGIVHRLDKDTTGVLMVAKNDLAQAALAEQIKNRTVKRLYLALVSGNIREDRGVVDAPIGRHPVDRKKMAVVERGRQAVTHFRVVERYGQYTLVEARLETGRTHQIRVHLTYIGHPLVGDRVYGSKKQLFALAGQALHAAVLGFAHPRTNEYLEFSAPLPADMATVVEGLRGKVD